MKGYVEHGSPQCVHVRAKPTDYSTRVQIEDFMATYGYHPGQCAISYGIPAHAPAIFNEYVKRAHLAGYTVHIHVISDAAARMAIEALEATPQIQVDVLEQVLTLVFIELVRARESLDRRPKRLDGLFIET